MVAVVIASSAKQAKAMAQAETKAKNKAYSKDILETKMTKKRYVHQIKENFEPLH